MRDWVHVEKPPGDGPFPVVVYFHHGPGFEEGSRAEARRIAEAGYFVAALDRYHRFEPWVKLDLARLRDPNPDNAERDRFMTMLTTTADDDVESDVSELLRDLDGEPAARSGQIGCIGYCIGARSVLRTIEHHPDVVAVGVALHPSFCVTDERNSPHLAVPSIAGRLYVGIGDADRMSTLEANQPLLDAVRELGDRGTVEIYAGADHGFAVPPGGRYTDDAERAHQHAVALFEKAL